MPNALSRAAAIYFAAALLTFPPSPAEAQGDKQYSQPDAGHLIYAVGTIRIGMRFSFPYHRTHTPDGAPVDDWNGSIRPSVGGALTLKVKNPDFQGFETGHVVIRRLPPGRYAVTDFEFAGAGAGTQTEWKSSVPFALEFTIEAGKATYIGSFMRSPTPNEQLRAELGYAGYFLIADRSERDLPIAAARLPQGIEITRQVTDVEKFGSNVLRSRSLEPAPATP
ncbi:MAG: hypothetical protein ACKVS7_08440 [Gemmatimonadaceae bacterium]